MLKRALVFALVSLVAGPAAGAAAVARTLFVVFAAPSGQSKRSDTPVTSCVSLRPRPTAGRLS